MYAFSAMKQPCFECDSVPTKKVGALYLCKDHAQTIHGGLAPRPLDLAPEPPKVVVPKPPRWMPTAEKAKPPKPPRPVKPVIIEGRPKCLIEGCESSAITRGLCEPHRKLHGRAGTMDEVALPSKLARSPIESRQIDLDRPGCVAVGCPRSRFRWLCEACYKRASKLGFLKELGLPKGRHGRPPKARRVVVIEGHPKCLIDGCESSAVKSGKCEACYHKDRRSKPRDTPAYEWPATQAAIDLGKVKCVAHKCHRQPKQVGLCAHHYGVAYRKGVLSSLVLPRYGKVIKDKK